MRDMSPSDLKIEQRHVMRGAGFAALVVGLAYSCSFFLAAPRVGFPAAVADRIAFALQANILVVVVLVVAVQRVSSGRYRSAEDNRGSAFGKPSERIAIDLAFLQNTLEQCVIAWSVNLALAATVSGDMLVFVPCACVLFVVGRIAFRFGYPHGAGARAFGMAVTALPSLVGAATVVWIGISNWLT